MKLSLGDDPVRIRRILLSEIFGPLGFNLLPSLEKLLDDVQDALRLIPYLGYGPVEQQFCGDVLAPLAETVGLKSISSDRYTSLIVEDDITKSAYSAFEFLKNDPYLPSPIENPKELVEFQSFLRKHPLSPELMHKMIDFFEAPVTVGVRDTLRFIEGSRHAHIPWEIVKRLINQTFMKYGQENFLPPEINYYTYWVKLPVQEVERRLRANKQAAKAFAKVIVEKFPLNWTIKMSDQELFEVAYSLLNVHFSYPVYEIEPYTGILSVATLKIMLKVAFLLPVQLLDIDLPYRRNSLSYPFIKRVRALQKFLEGLEPEQRELFFEEINHLLWEVDSRGGVREGEVVYPYYPIETTFYTLQKRAQSMVDRHDKIVRVTTLEDIEAGKDRDFLDNYKDLPDKLTVFFTLIYRYFLDTGFVPDLRPDRAGVDLFVKGIWGYKTKNLIILGLDTSEGPRAKVVFIDNKDQFKQYYRETDRKMPRGLARYALRLIAPIVEPAMQRSIGIYVKEVLKNTGEGELSHSEIKRLLAFGIDWIAHVTRTGISATLSTTQTVLEDLIEDTKDALLKLLK